MKKRILITIATLSGGGAERIASILGTELNRRDYEIHFLTFYDSAEYDFEGKYHTLNEKMKTSIFSKMSKLISRAHKISKFCKRKNIDTVISFMEEANFPAVLSKSFGNKSQILISEQNNPDENNKSYKFLIRRLYPKADMNIASSKSIENLLRNSYNVKKVTTIYNMQQLDKVIELSNNSIPKKYEKYFEDFSFINTGRLTKQKAQWRLIRSFRKVADKNPKSNLLIFGEGELKKKLNKLIKKLNLENNVHLLGFKNNIFPFLKKSDCFVLSSLWEGFGIVIIEALSVNTPVISTDCAYGPREILAPELNSNDKLYPYEGKHGILTKTFNNHGVFESLKEKPLSKEEEMLANQMIKIMDDKKLKKRYSNGLQRARDFDTKNIINEWENIV